MCDNNRLLFDESIELADNAMLKHRPDLFNEWDFEKNSELGLDVYTVTKGMDRKMWWNCPKCKSSYDASVSNRMIGRNCSYCRGYKVNDTNSLGDCHPQLALEWHPTKNGELSPFKITKNNSRKVWWLGRCGHEWDSVISSRSSGIGCPYCSSNKTLKGFNDMWTTNPELASLLLNPQDGYKYMQNSSVRVNWRCHECNSVVEKKQISLISAKGLSCPACSDGISFPEKFIYHLLTNQNILFEFQKSFNWSENKRYDFYLPKYNCIIETHGIQHYEDVQLFNQDGYGVEKQKKNDEEKCRRAISNGIRHYIVIDARESTVKHLSESIMNSYLTELTALDNVNFYEVGKKASSSLLFKSCLLWNDGYTSTEIGKQINLSSSTVVEYLKKGTKYGLCSYSYDKAKKRAGRGISKSMSKEILLLNPDNTIAMHFNNVDEASKKTNKKAATISKYCRGKRTHMGYKWIYKENYEKLLLSENGLEQVLFMDITSIKEVLQFDLDMNLIKQWKSAKDAATFIKGSHSNISAVCLGRNKSAGGFVWRYKEDYDKFLAEGGDPKSINTRQNWATQKVVQLDANMTFIKEWESITEAAVELASHASNISAVCKGINRTAKGFKWMFAEDYERKLGKIV